ncbi:hypothetical protein BGW36DRAFT_382613 [Talaromyces proteolyticus]|uniref:Uncharacterized protein n=1 Tax=Talaromyces proteolyticus TaxID=1131652 RepID=A0AAD4KPL0_9EURO|nr:uncharacterized protein BGW36DRAFT_382613 [Talaromyces proteolyticus]KAH8695393.1 hypothetical protein BGW36DRAFT_382613 [Talaromyces proteolyticus]
MDHFQTICPISSRSCNHTQKNSQILGAYQYCSFCKSTSLSRARLPSTILIIASFSGTL